MSDQIFINDNMLGDSIIINDNISQDTVNVTAEGSLVTSVNGRFGAIILNRNDVGLNQVDNTSDLNKPISSATLSALLLKTDLSAFNVLNDLVLTKYGSWDSVYATVNILSGNWNSVYSNVNSNSSNFLQAQTFVNSNSANILQVNSTVNTTSANWNSVYSNVNSNSSNFLQSQTFINSNSSNILQVNSTVNSTSANWNYAYNTVVGGLSSDLWNSTYTNFSKQSANNISVYAYVNANSGFESNQQNVTTFIISNSSNIINVNSLVNTTSANWNSAYTTWNLNSALDLAARTFVNSNSANIRQVNSTVNTTSANWNSAFNWVDTNKNNATFQTVSAISLSGVFYGDGSNLIGAALPGQADVNTLVRSNSGNWNSAYSTVQSNSATTWNYQGTDLKTLSSTWVGGNIAYTNLISNSAAYLSAVDLTLIQSTSANWNSVYSNVNSNSSNFLQAQTFVNTNSSNILQVNSTVNTTSANWNSVYSNVNSNSSNFLHSQTFVNSNSANILQVNSTVNTTSANWNSVYSNVNSNSATYATYNYVNNGFLPLSGGTISGATRINNNLTVFGNLTATGTTTFANTIFSVTSSLSVVHVGSGPALWVGNNGDGDIASFYDIDQNIEILHVGGINSTFPNVGVKTSIPNVDFTVNGQISANSIIWDANGNSNNWNNVYSNVNSQSANNESVYSTVQNNSALKWNYQGTDLKHLSGNWQSTYGTVSSLSSNWNSAYNIATTYQNSSGSFATNTLLQSTSALLTPLTLTNNLTSQLVLNSTLNGLSGNWQSTFGTVSSLSANWNGAYTSVRDTSANWNSVYSTWNSNSSFDLEARTFVNLNSANILQVNSTVNTTSANWNSVYSNVNSNSSNFLQSQTFVNSNSANILQVNTKVNSTSANWDSVYSTWNSNSSFDLEARTFVNLNSANIRQVNSTVNITSANWNSVYSNVNSNSSNFLQSQTFVNSNSANILQVNSTVNTTSANWNSVYSTWNSNSSFDLEARTFVNLNSANIRQVNSTVNTTSANWSNAYTNLVLNSAAYIATPVYGTTNQIVATPGGGNSVTLSLPAEMIVPNNLSVIGNFFVSGSATQINTTNLVVNDPLVYIANNNIANINDIGVIGRFNNGLSQSTGLVRSATTGNWTLFSGVTANLLSATNVNFDDPTFKVDTLRANIIGNVTGTIYDWMTLVRGYKTTPTLLQTIAGGDVYTYTYATSASDRTYYRYIANDGSEDSFYGNFVGGTLSNLIARKAIIL